MQHPSPGMLVRFDHVADNTGSASEIRSMPRLFLRVEYRKTLAVGAEFMKIWPRQISAFGSA